LSSEIVVASARSVGTTEITECTEKNSFLSVWNNESAEITKKNGVPVSVSSVCSVVDLKPGS